MEGLEMKYFVINPRSKHPNDIFALASRNAMREYARTIKNEHPRFATDLVEWAWREIKVKEEQKRGD